MPAFMARYFRKPDGLFGWYAARFMVKRNGFVYPAIARYAGFEPGMQVFEIGYGPGVGLDRLIRDHGVEMEGLDFSSRMFRKASRLNRPHLKAGTLCLAHGDFLDFAPRPGAHDRVIFANVSYFWADLVPPFTKIRSMLKPGGKLVFYMSSRDRLDRNPMTASTVFHRHETRHVLDCLAGCGFARAAAHQLEESNGDFLIVEAHAD